VAGKSDIDLDLGLYFEEKTPKMVESWKSKKGVYHLIYENQQATERNRQATERNRQETRLYNALHGLK